jgi:glycosyltransferase involved in cell wall biosynthesis
MLLAAICAGFVAGALLLGQGLTHIGLDLSIILSLVVGVLLTINRAVRSRSSLRPGNRSNARVSFVTASHHRGYYNQPLLREFVKTFPRTSVLVGKFPGFLPDCRNSFEVYELPGTRNFVVDGEVCFRWLPLSLIKELYRVHPDVIILGQFTLWTFYAVLYKLFRRCRILFLWDGTAPLCAYLNSPLRLLWRRILGRFVDAAISNTHEGVQYLSQVIHIPRSKITHGVYLVADADSLSYGCHADEIAESPAPRPTFLYVGSLSKRKGVRLLIEAAMKLKEQEITNFSIILVGEGPQEELRQAISGELEPIVHIVGAVDYTQLGKYYHNCDAFILPSLEDLWGMVVPEAMVFGKAVLCSKYANAKDLVQHGVNGFVFDPLNPTELASYMTQIIRNPRLCTDFGRASSAIISKYTPTTAAALIADAVTELLPSQRTRSRQLLRNYAE